MPLCRHTAELKSRPFEAVDVCVPSVTQIDQLDISRDLSKVRIVKNADSLVEPWIEDPILPESHAADLASTLQYTQGFGNLGLRNFAKEHIQVLQ